MSASEPASAIREPGVSFPIVGIGASAGGLEAISRLLEILPPSPGLALVVVMHLDPDHESLLPSLLSQVTALPVVEVGVDTPIQVDHVYIGPPRAVLALEGSTLTVRPRASVRAPNMPIDHLFRSLAHQLQQRAVGVVLSGGGTDGTLGVQDISAEDGIAFAQDERSARFDSMPRSAVASGCIDVVLDPAGIGQELVRLAQHSRTGTAPPGERGQREHLNRLFALVSAMSGIDFSQYKLSTIHRRIQRRMAMVGIESLAAYVDRLEEDQEELQSLYQDFLIRVTRFFRDPTVYATLHETVFPELVKNRAADLPIRIWVAGCATGEEAYSLVIALLEFLDERHLSFPIKMLATDISEVALERARAGVYIENIEVDVSPERLRRFFAKVNGQYQISKSIRDMCVFARHNVARDPPFSRLDLVTCRNVLIYLSPVLQKRVIPIFHYALRPHSYLVLGTSETTGSFDDLFELVSEKNKVYRKKPSLPATTGFEFDVGGLSTRQTPPPGAQRPSLGPPSTCSARPTGWCCSATGPPAWWWTTAAPSCTSAGTPATTSSRAPARPASTCSAWCARGCCSISASCSIRLGPSTAPSARRPSSCRTATACG
jgi:two-component system CheB/CheR fusion protein